MNKKWYLYNILMTLLMINQQSFCMQAKLLQYAANSALISTVTYGGGKIAAMYKSYISEDMPEKVDAWVRTIYAKNGLENAASIPLKVGNGSYSCAGHFIALDRKKVDSLNFRLDLGNNSENEFALDERVALHELEHHKDGYFGKKSVIAGCTLSSLLQPSSSFPVFALKLGMVVGINLTHIRYQEAEANRSAYNNISSLDKLEIIKQNYVQKAQDFEWNLRHCHFDVDRNWVERIIRPIISKQLHALDQKKVESNDQEDHLAFEWRQKQLIKLASFAFDHEHPDFRTQVEIVQGCINQRKSESEQKDS